MNFLKNIDWYDHDGVNLPMINDFLRNQFYDTIIRNNVNGHHCIDIGFGNGLLSMMALRYGAKSVVAFESDLNRFFLANHIVKKLNLENKIHLVNERFNYNKLNQYPKVDVIFHETLDSNGWSDGLFYNLPRTSNIRFLPNNYELELIAAPISRQFATALLTPAPIVPGFNPGVDVDVSFIKLINELGFPQHELPIESIPDSGLVAFDFERETIYGWQLALKFARSIKNSVAGYKINSWEKTNKIFDKHGIKSTQIDFNITSQEMIIDTSGWKNKIVLMVPRFKVMDGEAEMILDTGHWGFLKSPILIVNPTSDLLVTHSLITGNLEYKLN